jgi:hypothetical protein
VAAISDSGRPKNRRCRSGADGIAVSSSATGAVTSASGHMPCSSRGGPGSTTTSGPDVGTTSPGAVPTGSRAIAPRGTIACLRVASSSAGPAKPLRCAQAVTIPEMRSRIRSSSSSGASANCATTSPVRSSAVGPSPPLVTTSVAPRTNSSASRRSWGRSPTTRTCETSNPSVDSSRESHGPLASGMVPVSSSLPVTITAARGRAGALTGGTLPARDPPHPVAITRPRPGGWPTCHRGCGGSTRAARGPPA